jgi:FMN-dependent NADH-azoreductase
MKMNILHIDSSPLEGRSISRDLSARIVAGLAKRFPGSIVVRRDVGVEAMPHADAEIIDIVRYKKDEDLSSRQLQERALANALIAELEAADFIVIGSPMYNYTISTQLKVWLDRVCQSGKTFRYTPNGPIGLLPSRKHAIVVIARGGNYTNGKQNHRDFQTPYLREILKFIGITDVKFVVAEGVNISPEEKARVIKQAGEEINAILDSLATAKEFLLKQDQTIN